MGSGKEHDLVLPKSIGSLFNPSNLRNRSFKRIKARSDVREDLRFPRSAAHCATLLLGKSVNVKVVSDRLGHASVTITLDVYSHVLPDLHDSAADAMEAVLGTAS